MSVETVDPTTTTTKSGQVEEDEKVSKKSDFSIESAKFVNSAGEVVPAYDDKGRLTAVPVAILNDEGDTIYEGYSRSSHNPLKKSDFANEYTFMEFRAWQSELQASNLIERAGKLRERATMLRKFGDENTRKKALKRARLREQLMALEAELEGEGITFEEESTEN